MPQVEEERKEAEAIKEKVAKDEAAVATRQEEVMLQRLNVALWQGFRCYMQKYKGITAGAQPKFPPASWSVPSADPHRLFPKYYLLLLLYQ